MAVLVPHNYFFVNVSTLVYSLSLSLLCARVDLPWSQSYSRALDLFLEVQQALQDPPGVLGEQVHVAHCLGDPP